MFNAVIDTALAIFAYASTKSLGSLRCGEAANSRNSALQPTLATLLNWTLSFEQSQNSFSILRLIVMLYAIVILSDVPNGNVI